MCINFKKKSHQNLLQNNDLLKYAILLNISAYVRVWKILKISTMLKRAQNEKIYVTKEILMKDCTKAEYRYCLYVKKCMCKTHMLRGSSTVS